MCAGCGLALTEKPVGSGPEKVSASLDLSHIWSFCCTVEFELASVDQQFDFKAALSEHHRHSVLVSSLVSCV